MDSAVLYAAKSGIPNISLMNILNCKPADVKPNRPAMTARRSRTIAFEQGYKCNAFDCPNKDSIMSEWDIDHIIPWAWSFNDTRSNLQALCLQCHKNKTDTIRYSNSISYSIRPLRGSRRRPRRADHHRHPRSVGWRGPMHGGCRPNAWDSASSH